VMAEEAKATGAILVHYSTDYVFDGSKTTPYEVNDLTNPQNVYGKTKLEGERAIQDSGAHCLIFRTEWVYGIYGKNFFLTILRLATQREELRIVCNQTGAPTLSTEIAKATTTILSQVCGSTDSPSAGSDCGPTREALSIADVSGIYHMTASGQTTWFEFAAAILEESRAIKAAAPWFTAATNNLPLVAQRIIPIPASEYPTPARRPTYSVLSNESLVRTFSVRLPDWRTQLRSVFAESSFVNL
jgi:dTDP-4-dehydrorhamnose reductase